MIARLTGKISYLDMKYIVIDVHGVGYKVFATNETLEKAGEVGEEISLWIHHVIREDASDLFGFPTRDSIELFELLITISGIGPRTALGVLNTTTADTLYEAVQTGDISLLTKISGIGKKMAEKIVLELRDKIGHIEEKSQSSQSSNVIALEALISLGYTERDAREAIKKMPKDLSTEEQIKLALKNLN